MSSTEDLRKKGNELFQKKQYDEAIKVYTEILEFEEGNHTVFSNRSACYCALKKFSLAAADARKTIEIKPDWPRGHTRLGAALEGERDFQGAINAYQEALRLEPGNDAALQGIERCKNGMNSSGPNMGSIFTPDKIAKLQSDPVLREKMSDPQFLAKLQNISPASFQDPDIMRAFQILFDLPEGAGAAPGSQGQEAKQPAAEAEVPKPKPAEKAKPAPKPTGSNEEAEKEKCLGNEAFGNGKIEEAISHYDKAIELDPQNMAYKNNKATALSKLGKHQEAIDFLNKAIEDGRANQANFEDIAKSYTKIASAYVSLDNLEQAIEALKSSLLEKRDPIVKRELTRLENLKSKRDAEAYENPELAEKARLEGNEYFRKKDFPKAIECYTEAIKRAPRDATPYSNRSAAYCGLGEYPMALKDAEKAIELDPKFVKAYNRKGLCHLNMKEYHKAIQAYQDALAIDPNSAEAISGLNTAREKSYTSGYDKDRAERSMADPEIQAILRDPFFMNRLQELQSNPSKAAEYMRDPDFTAKFEKLRQAGVLGVG